MKTIFLTFIFMLSTFSGMAQIDSATTTADSMSMDSPVTTVVQLDDDEFIIDSTGVHPFEHRIRMDFKFIQLMGLLVPFASAVGIVWLILAYRNRRHRDKLHVIELSIIHHEPLPESFYHSTIRDPHRRLTTGIYWLGAGLSITLLFVMVCPKLWPIGLFPLFIGIARVAAYACEMDITGKKSMDEQSEE